MQFTLKAGSRVSIGSMPLTLIEDTTFKVEANSLDEIAEKLWAAGPRAFGEHQQSLSHRDVKRKLIDNQEHEVEIEVTYGAGGARVENEVKGSQPRRLNQDGTQAVARGGIGTETVPGASGSGEAAKERNRRLKGPGASNDDEEEQTSEEKPKLPRKQDFEEEPTDRTPSSPRTEFIVPPKRFPDEVLTPTDPPLTEVVADSPARSVPFVGEFKRDGSFARQGALEDRVETEGRPNPSPDTPGTRDRKLPHPSETDKNTPDETARNLKAMVSEMEPGSGSDRQEREEKQKADKERVEKTDNTEAEQANKDTEDDEDLSNVSDEDEDDDLPEDFPHRTLLEKAGVTKWSELEGKTAEELSGEDFKGIGPAGAADIVSELRKKKRRDTARAKRRSEKK